MSVEATSCHMPPRAPLLEIQDLAIEFAQDHRRVRVVDGVSFSVHRGETVCLVGESGCGKTVTALAIGRLLSTPPAAYAGGLIRLEGDEVLRMTASELRRIRGEVVSYVFQEPGASLNPVLQLRTQIKESLRLHCPEVAHDREVVRLLRLVGIAEPELRLKSYPHELSGGMQQRAMIAMAIATRPKLLIADEPTTALDATIQAQILELLRQLKTQLDMSILLITHDLGIVNELGDRVVVMYAGQVVEMAPARALLDRPLHPYTRALLRSVPRLGGAGTALEAIPGNVPPAGAFPPGCRFHPRCDRAQPECSDRQPTLVEVEPGRWVRCPFWPI